MKWRQKKQISSFRQNIWCTKCWRAIRLVSTDNFSRAAHLFLWGTFISFFNFLLFSVPLLSIMFYLLTLFSGALQESILTRPAIVELRSLSFLFVFVWLVLFAWFKRNTSFFHQTSEHIIESVETKLKIENYPVFVEVVTVADVNSRAIKPQKKFFISCLLSVFLHQWWWKIMLLYFFYIRGF